MNESAPRKKVVIVYEYFYPGFLAGGPIQSLVNMVKELHSLYDFRIITSAYDLNSTQPYTSIKSDSWNRVNLPSMNEPIQVWYNNSRRMSAIRLTHLVAQTGCDFLYVNGLFTSWSTWSLLLNRFARKGETKLILAPRGMLQKGALGVKPFKKRLFFFFMKLVGGFNKVHWHATDEQELADISVVARKNNDITIASNIPKEPSQLKEARKRTGQLRMVFLSLITEKKNLLLALEALKEIPTRITFHIYGPIKDQSYWSKCVDLIKENQIHEIEYLGSVNSVDVQEKLSTYDVMILPTKGENFGHAIYESLSVGTPVIVSKHTPWGKLHEHRAGITVESDQKKDWKNAIQAFIDLNERQYRDLTLGAYSIAKDYYLKSNFKVQYKALFCI